MSLITYPYYIPGNDDNRATTTVDVDPATGKFYLGSDPLVQFENGTIGAAPRASDDERRYTWLGVDPKTDYILSDPISVKMLQSGYQPTDMGNVYFNPTTQKYAISRNQEGIDKIWGGFYQSYDPQTGAVIIGDASRGWDIVNHAINYRNSIYTGGDWMSNFLGAAGPAIMMGGVGALAAPALAAAIPEAAGATVAPEIAAELAGLQASTTGLGSGIGAPSIVEQLVSNLPSVSTMTQNAAINAATQLATTGKVDPEKVLTSTVTGAIATGVGTTVGNEVSSATDSALASSIASGATKGAVTGAITGNDPFQTALASGAASGLGSLVQDSGIKIPQAVINSVVSGIANNQPLNQVLTGAAISVGTGLAKDAISSAYNA